MTWTDTPGLWTPLTGSTDFFVAYIIGTTGVAHKRQGTSNINVVYASVLAEIS
jgi:hypothetical protein